MLDVILTRAGVANSESLCCAPLFSMDTEKEKQPSFKCCITRDGVQMAFPPSSWSLSQDLYGGGEHVLEEDIPLGHQLKS